MTPVQNGIFIPVDRGVNPVKDTLNKFTVVASSFCSISFDHGLKTGLSSEPGKKESVFVIRVMKTLWFD